MAANERPHAQVGVLVVEDQTITAEYFESIVARAGGFHLVRTLPSAETAPFHCERGGIDLVIMDVFTALGADGIDATSIIKRRCPQVRVIVVTSLPEASSLARAWAAGADSFWYKDDTSTDLLEVMERTMAGERVWPRTTPQVRIGLASSDELTAREVEVLRLVVAGLSNREIGEELGIGAATVKDYVGSILVKTGLHGRVELAVAATRTGFIIGREG